MNEKRPYHHIVNRVIVWKREGRTLDEILAYLTNEAWQEGASPSKRYSRLKQAEETYNEVQ